MSDHRPLTEPEQEVIDAVKAGKPPEPGTPEHRIFQSLEQEGIVQGYMKKHDPKGKGEK